MDLIRLNLGCGDKKMAGYLNVDTCGEPDFACDLSRFPWPWSDGSVDEVFSSHFLEHVEDYEKTVLEMHRVLKPDGIVHFLVPHFRNPLTPWHLHRWPFSIYTPERLCQKLPYQWGGRQLFAKERIRARFSSIRRSVGVPLGVLANLFPLFWDWAGLPIDEVEFVGRKVPDGR
jgi:SAM-dependent methyltransferase